jgi:hypothetical protein
VPASSSKRRAAPSLLDPLGGRAPHGGDLGAAVFTYDYAIVRVVPRVERGEFINAGVILSCAELGLLQAAIELDETRLLALDPGTDLPGIRAALAAIPLICAGGDAAGALGRLSTRERFHWLVAPRSSSIQTSAVHTGRCEAPGRMLDQLMRKMVRRPAPPATQPDQPAT